MSNILNRGRSAKTSVSTILFAGALIAVIIFAIIFTVWEIFFYEEVHPRDVVELHFKCSGCGTQFGLTVKELHEEILAEAGDEGVNYRARANCPNCGLKGGGEMMIKCPKCMKHYVPQSREQPVCAFCGTDYFMFLGAEDDPGEAVEETDVPESP
jgi:hypothetical protein